MGAALSMQSCVKGSSCWRMKRITTRSFASDYIGVCSDTGFKYPHAPTSSSFDGLVIGFASVLASAAAAAIADGAAGAAGFASLSLCAGSGVAAFKMMY